VSNEGENNVFHLFFSLPYSLTQPSLR